jgi:AcrR family transcriptional regulator
MKKSDLMRDFILAKSEALFTQLGYKNTSMEKIAETCDISKPTLYNYFSSKSALFFELFTRFQSAIAEKGRSLMMQDKDKYAVIEEIIDLSLDFVEEKRDFLRMMVRDHHMVVHDQEDITKRIDQELRRRQDIARDLGEFMKEVVRPEVLAEFTPEMIGMALNTLLEGAFWDTIKGEFSDHEKQKKLIMKLLKNGILA